jgi:hypothetical protein
LLEIKLADQTTKPARMMKLFLAFAYIWQVLILAAVIQHQKNQTKKYWLKFLSFPFTPYHQSNTGPESPGSL